jgi:NAD-dependent dihydropyrimidine dehydrogenase PreA subunit
MERSDVIIKPELCKECLSCQLICSLVNLGAFNPLKAYITIDRDQIEFTDDCTQCNQCLPYCGYGAIASA